MSAPTFDHLLAENVALRGYLSRAILDLARRDGHPIEEVQLRLGIPSGPVRPSKRPERRNPTQGTGAGMFAALTPHHGPQETT